MKWLIGTLIIAGARLAYADQCTTVSSEMAERARQVIADHPMVITFCEPCNDRVPGEPVPLQAVSSGANDVRFNGEQIDLAYTYVQTSPRRYDNLALLVGCPVTGVSPGLRVEDATADGVLIVPDGAAVVSPLAARETYDWGPIIAGASAASTLWLAAMLIRRRRRRAHRPRL